MTCQIKTRVCLGLVSDIKVEDFKEMDGHHMVVSSGPNDTVTGISSSSILAANEPIEAAFSDEEDPDDIPIGITEFSNF